MFSGYDTTLDKQTSSRGLKQGSFTHVPGIQLPHAKITISARKVLKEGELCRFHKEKPVIVSRIGVYHCSPTVNVRLFSG